MCVADETKLFDPSSVSYVETHKHLQATNKKLEERIATVVETFDTRAQPHNPPISVSLQLFNEQTPQGLSVTPSSTATISASEWQSLIYKHAKGASENMVTRLSALDRDRPSLEKLGELLKLCYILDLVGLKEQAELLVKNKLDPIYSGGLLKTMIEADALGQARRACPATNESAASRASAYSADQTMTEQQTLTDEVLLRDSSSLADFAQNWAHKAALVLGGKDPQLRTRLAANLQYMTVITRRLSDDSRIVIGTRQIPPQPKRSTPLPPLAERPPTHLTLVVRGDADGPQPPTAS